MDVSETNFQTAVVDRSQHRSQSSSTSGPSWCGPCRQLGPVLERAVAARAGKLELVKLDVDANPSLARAFRIQGIPAVKAFRDGRVVSRVRRRSAPDRRGSVPRFAAPLGGRRAGATRRRGIASTSPRARADATRCGGGAGPDPQEPRRDRRGTHGAGESARKLCRRRSRRPDRARVAAAKNSSGPAVPGLSEAFAALDAGDHERALDLLLAAIPNADGARDDVRRVVVGVLDELGVEHPLARDARRRLASALY